MAKLIYSAITSLDGYVADANGKFDWSEPDEEVHSFVNDLERPIGIYLYGRRMYEVMVYWDKADRFTEAPSYVQDYARIWQAADKVVYSTTLDSVSSAKTRIAEHFDPGGIRQLKEIADRDISIGGADLAGQAIMAGLVDDYHLLVSPVVVGGGHKALPDDIRVKLQLRDHRSFANGVVHLHYQLPPKDEWPTNGELSDT